MEPRHADSKDETQPLLNHARRVLLARDLPERAAGRRNVRCGELRVIERIERLEAIDDSQKQYRYSMISGIPAANYVGTIDVKPKGSGSSMMKRAGSSLMEESGELADEERSLTDP